MFILILLNILILKYIIIILIYFDTLTTLILQLQQYIFKYENRSIKI